MADIPDDLKPKRIDENTVEFLGIKFVSTPAPPKPVPVPKPTKLAKVRLAGEDGNVYSILGRCLAAGKRAGYTPEQLQCFKDEAMSEDYDHALQTCMAWFEVE